VTKLLRLLNTAWSFPVTWTFCPWVGLISKWQAQLLELGFLDFVEVQDGICWVITRRHLLRPGINLQYDRPESSLEWLESQATKPRTESVRRLVYTFSRGTRSLTPMHELNKMLPIETMLYSTHWEDWCRTYERRHCRMPSSWADSDTGMFDTPGPSRIPHSYTRNPGHVSRATNHRPGTAYLRIYFYCQSNGIARVPGLTTRNASTGTHIGSPEPLITFTFMLNLITSTNELQFSTQKGKLWAVLLYMFLGDEIFLDDRLMCRSAVGHS
jgi:hypothetical protein